MDLQTKINENLKEAIKAKDSVRVSTLRLINAAIKDREIARRGGDDSETGIDDGDVLQILGKMVKQRQESVRAYEEGGRLELAESEQAEISVLEAFLPKQLDPAETSAAIDAAIARTKAEGIRDMGRVMAELKGKYTGQLDFGQVGPEVKARLTK
ncbi:MAG: GatB/YqeY domain-containing protein [Paracoccaceae bacterium]|nr:GatB/YqeY domain-containing protein [Paracoccaceae bacterium]